MKPWVSSLAQKRKEEREKEERSEVGRGEKGKREGKEKRKGTGEENTLGLFTYSQFHSFKL